MQLLKFVFIPTSIITIYVDILEYFLFISVEKHTFTKKFIK